MYLGDDEILVESRIARERQMAGMTNERAEHILNQAKAIIFAAWKGEGIASTEQVAEFYEISPNTVRSATKVREYREELNSDGLKVARSKELREVRSVIDLTPDTPQAMVWSPRAALRLAMFLRDSDIARQVRTLLVEMATQGGIGSNERELMLQIELQRLRQQYQNSLQQYQDTGFQIVQAYGSAMLSFIRGQEPLVRTEIQYVDHQTGKPLGVTTRYRILAQLVEDVGLQRNSEEDQQRVKDILRYKLGVDWETGEGLDTGFTFIRPLVIPEERYWDYVRVVAIDLYGEAVLAGWSEEQQFLSAYLNERGILPPGE